MKKNDVKMAFKYINIDLNDTQQEQFVRYYELLVEWNSFMNLTAIIFLILDDILFNFLKFPKFPKFPTLLTPKYFNK